MKTTVLIKLDPRDPDLSRIREIARGFQEGKIVAFPTETVYGIGAPMSLPNAVTTLDRIKNREPGKPYSYHIGSLDMVERLGVVRDSAFKFLTRQFWPGPVTVLCKNQSGEKIGIRYPRHRLTSALINTVGEPFIATSANLSGKASPRTAEEVMQQLGGQVDYLIDGGRTDYAEDSTIVDVTGAEPVIVRRGALANDVSKVVDRIRLGKFPRKRILFVCTGNSCRSPMAEVWLERQLELKGLENEIEVASCGIGTRGGSSATTEAVLVMQNREIDLKGHRSKTCTREDVMDADLIFAMSEDHVQFLHNLAPAARTKIKLLNIPDPIGLGMMIYEEVLNGIERKMKEYWNDVIA